MTKQYGPEGLNLAVYGSEKGIRWAVCKHLWSEAFNGYARVPKDHPWFGVDYYDIDADVDIHGGLTFGNADGWIGFYTLHAGDFWPGMENMSVYGFQPRLWDVWQVVDEAKKLARIIKEASDD